MDRKVSFHPTAKPVMADCLPRRPWTVICAMTFG